MKLSLWMVPLLLAIAWPLPAQNPSEIDQLATEVDELQDRLANLPEGVEAAQLWEQAQQLREEVIYMRVALRRGGSISRQELDSARTRLGQLRAELDRVEGGRVREDLELLQREVTELELEIEGARGSIDRSMETDVDQLAEQVTYLKVRDERARAGGAEAVSPREVAEAQEQLGILRRRLDAELYQPARYDAGLEVPVGERLLVRLDDYISSKSADPGDRFDATVVDPVMVGAQLAIPQGTVMHGIVAGVDRAGRMDRKARLFLDFDAITLAGRRVPLAASVISGEDDPNALEGKGFKGDTEKVIAGSAIGTILGAILGGGKGALAGLIVGGTGSIIATKGQDVELPPGTGLWVQIDEPLIVPAQ
ncbi:MAG TPA: hypothetical protein VGB99_18150 [Acidobacteriota bacterium]